MPDPNPVLDEFTKEFERLQNQKSHNTGGVEARILTNLAFLEDEHYVVHSLRRLTVRSFDANKLHLVFNLSTRMMFKLIGRLCSINGVYSAVPDTNAPDAKADAQVVDKLLMALDEKVGQPTKTWEILFWMAVGGVAFSYETWLKDAVEEPMPSYDEMSGELLWTHNMGGQETVVPESQRQQMIAQGMPPEHFELKEEMRLTGEISSEILSPLQVFIDASVRSISDLNPDQSVYIAKIRTVEWIKDNFEELDEDTLNALEGNQDLRIIKTTFEQPDGATTGNAYLNDIIPRIQGSRSEDDPEMVVVVERYQGVSKRNPRGRYTVFVPAVTVLQDGPNPYGEIPLVDFHWSPATTTFWTKDYLSTLIAPQRFLNKRMSQLGEQANASIYSNELLGPGMTADKIPPDYPTPIEGGLNEQGTKMVQRRDPPQLPNWFLHSIDLSIKLLRELAGGSDLFQEDRFPGQLRGPLAVPMLQEILDTEWGPLYEHIGERMARVKQIRVNLVKRFYPPSRTLHYTDYDMREEVFTFHKEEILNSGNEYRITVERSSLLPELRALREQRIITRLQSPLGILYTDPRTGQLSADRIEAELRTRGGMGRRDREEQARKLACELAEMIYKGEPIPPHIPMPFWDLSAMMDELEAKMQTMEFVKTSVPVQQAMIEFWERCRSILSQQQEAQQSAMQQQMVQNSVAQATQQAAAQAAAEAIDAARGQIRAATGAAPEAPEQLTRAMADQQEGPPRG